jgi:hypothetical protein
MDKQNRVDNRKKRKRTAPASAPADGPQEERFLITLVCNDLDDDQVKALATTIRQISHQYITQQLPNPLGTGAIETLA